jgi:hypothetical protein
MNQVSIVQAMYFNHNEHTRHPEDIVMSREKVKSLVTQKHRLTTHCLYIIVKNACCSTMTITCLVIN